MNIIKKIILKRIIDNYGSISYFSTPKQKYIIDLIKKIRTEKDLLLNDHEAFELYVLANSLNELKGDIAEVGTYQGASAKLMLEATKNVSKKIFVFDTFEGLPHNDPYHGVKKGDYYSNYDKFLEYLGGDDRVIIKKGFFPESAKDLVGNFSLVHIDTDLYQSTLDALNFFYPKMIKGGIIISHDYIKNTGVNNAFKEFCKLNEYPYVLEVAGSTQGLIVKLD